MVCTAREFDHGAVKISLSTSILRNRTGEGTKRQTLCDKRDSSFV